MPKNEVIEGLVTINSWGDVMVGDRDIALSLEGYYKSHVRVTIEYITPPEKE